MRILMVAPYLPWRDGIAAYTLQSVQRLRRQGNDVEVLSPQPSAAHHHRALAGWRGPLQLGEMVGGYDLTILQFHPDVFYPIHCLPAERVAISLGLAAALRRCRRSEVVVHEVDYNRLARPVQRAAFRAFLAAAGSVVVHTAAERDRLAGALGWPVGRIRLRTHGGDFSPRTRHLRSSARASLGIPAEGHVFLCIGFIQPHKGFDRAVRAFAGLGSRGAHLYVVGSVRVDEAEYQVHLAELRGLVERTPGAVLRVGYITDELFDRWIVAADTIVLPYRMIWSSSVLGRAALLHRPVIATEVGGLGDQAPPGSVLVGGDEELRSAMWRAVTGGTAADMPSPDAAEATVPGAPHFPATLNESADAVMRLVRERGAEIRAALGTAEGAAASTPGPQPYDRLLALPPLSPPVAVASSRARRALKLIVARLTRWEVDPIVRQVNALHAAVLHSFSERDEPRSGQR